MTAEFFAGLLVGVPTGICIMVAINLVGSWFIERYFEERQ